MFGLAPTLGLAGLSLAFRAGAFSGVEIYFYRGVAVIAVLFGLTLALALAACSRAADLRARDAVSASVLSFAVNLSFFVLSPVTVDRSVSVFMLGEMAARPQQAYTAEEVRSLFTEIYIGQHRQIERRLAEQTATGNLARVGDRYVITPQGEAFMRLSRGVAELFDTDRRLVDGRAAAPSASAILAAGSSHGPVRR